MGKRGVKLGEKHNYTNLRLLEVAKQIVKGKARSELHKIFCAKWNLVPRTMDEYIRKARPIADKIIERQSEKLAEAEADAEVKENLMTWVEKRKILAQIARGEIKYMRTVVTKMGPVAVEVVPTYKEREDAIDIDNKMAGHYKAPDADKDQSITFIFNEVKPNNED